MLEFLHAIRMEVFGATIAAIAAFAALYQGSLARGVAARQERAGRVQWTLAQLATIERLLATSMAAGPAATAGQRAELEAAVRVLDVAIQVGAADSGTFKGYLAVLPSGTQGQLRNALLLPAPTAAQAGAPMQRLLSAYP